MRHFTIGLSAFLLISACGSAPKPPPQPVLKAQDEAPWQPSRKEAKAWKALMFRTQSTQVASDRLIIEAWGRPGKGVDSIEMRLLARAGAEAQQLGFSHFAIVQIQDRNLPKSGGLLPSTGLASGAIWIGTYEDLVYNRAEREQAASPRTWLVPGLEAVVVLLHEDHRKSGKSFDASETFDLIGRTGIAN